MSVDVRSVAHCTKCASNFDRNQQQPSLALPVSPTCQGLILLACEYSVKKVIFYPFHMDQLSVIHVKGVFVTCLT